jgi:hypothetical protein
VRPGDLRHSSKFLDQSLGRLLLFLFKYLKLLIKSFYLDSEKFRKCLRHARGGLFLLEKKAKKL